jgi:hypothetical protein
LVGVFQVFYCYVFIYYFIIINIFGNQQSDLSGLQCPPQATTIQSPPTPQSTMATVSHHPQPFTSTHIHLRRDPTKTNSNPKTKSKQKSQSQSQSKQQPRPTTISQMQEQIHKPEKKKKKKPKIY